MKSIVETKSIWVFVFVFLFSLPVNADFPKREERVNSFETKKLDGISNKESFNVDVFTKNERPLRSTNDDDPNGGDEPWIGKPTPVGDAVWFILALSLAYGFTRLRIKHNTSLLTR
jgi:hypothetical protein